LYFGRKWWGPIATKFRKIIVSLAYCWQSSYKTCNSIFSW
jgi:hypothetical protein